MKSKQPRIDINGRLAVPMKVFNKHFLIAGSTQEGKSTTIERIIASWPGKIIILDPKLEYITKFYERGDVVLNPLDEGYKQNIWDLFATAEMNYMYDAISKRVANPQKYRDDFWVFWPREIITAVCMYGKATDKLSMTWLRDFFLKGEDGKGPEASIFMAMKMVNPAIVSAIARDSGQTQGIITEIMRYSKLFRYLGQEGASWSIADWLNNPKAGKIFLPIVDEQKAVLLPVYTLFFDMFFDYILSRRKKHNILVVLEEFPDLERPISGLLSAAQKGAGIGVTLLLSLQSTSQFYHIYGRENARTLLDNIKNVIAFKVYHDETAKELSWRIGHTLKEKIRESHSFDSTQGKGRRSSVNIDKDTAPIVKPEFFQNIETHNFYLKLDNFPPALLKTAPLNLPETSPGFVKNRNFLSDNIELFPVKRISEQVINKEKRGKRETILDGSKVIEPMLSESMQEKYTQQEIFNVIGKAKGRNIKSHDTR